jgi:hypothetical protein
LMRSSDIDFEASCLEVAPAAPFTVPVTSCRRATLRGQRREFHRSGSTTCGLPVKLGGDTATTVDQAKVTAGRLPLFIGAVVVSFLLWRAFRAPVIALKAGVFTILSILAASAWSPTSPRAAGPGS